MSYDAFTFTSEIERELEVFAHYANHVAEITAIQTGLGTDTTTHDATNQTPPVATQININKTPFQNAILLIVNRGKAGNLPNSTMAAAIGSAIAHLQPPTNTVAPVVSGTGTVGQVLTCTNGTWTNATTFTRQWLRGGTNIAGATGTTYTLVAADSGTNVSCRVTATNVNGSTNATSNAIAVT